MSVVQRCPSCGTTKATSGECEACHEAQVRYFCTSHTPGLWLDASTCPQCGARFGDPPRIAAAPAPPASARPRSPAPTSARPAAYPPVRPPKPTPGAWPSRKRPISIEEERLDPRASRMLLLQKIVEAAIRARTMPTRGAFGRTRSPVGRGAGGCLTRFLVGAFLLFLALASGVFVFGRALLLG